MKRKLYAHDGLPPVVFPMPDVTASSQAENIKAESAGVSGENAKSPQSSGQGARKLAHVAAETLTDTQIFECSRVKGCCDEVMAPVKHDSPTGAKSEIEDISSG